MRRDLPDLEHYRFSGSYALKDVLQTSAFGTPAQAIAALTKFSHPRTVSQTKNRNLFRAIRLPNGGELDDDGKAIKRGHYADYGDGSRVMLDDNQSPTNAFVWANSSSLKGYSDIQFNHVWFGAKDVDLYTSLANLCITPAFLAKLTDTDKEICALLQYRAYELFDGFAPHDKHTLAKPGGYDDLTWASPLPEVNDLEAIMRRAIQTKPRNRTVCSIQELGWYFSGFMPEPRIKTT